MITNIRESNGLLYGKILGEIDIYGSDMEDLKLAAKETLQCFIIACNKCGEGLEKELLKMCE